MGTKKHLFGLELTPALKANPNILCWIKDNYHYFPSPTMAFIINELLTGYAVIGIAICSDFFARHLETPSLHMPEHRKTSTKDVMTFIVEAVGAKLAERVTSEQVWPNFKWGGGEPAKVYGSGRSFVKMKSIPVLSGADMSLMSPEIKQFPMRGQN